MIYPTSIQNLIKEFNNLPGIGTKTSERFVFYILSRPQEELQQFSQAIKELKEKIVPCPRCFNFTEKRENATLCALCASPSRNKKIICVVPYPQELMAMEKSGEYTGLYHVLGGYINPLDNITPDKLRISQLLQRIKAEAIEEVIMGFNPDMEGETTSLYLIKVLKPLGIKVSRLARGLPMGASLEYADEITLSNALKGRREA